MLKDKKIVVYRHVEGSDQWGDPVEYYIPIHPGSLWAYTRQLSAQELYMAGVSDRYQETALFVVNWRNDLSPSLLVLYRGNWYNIVRIDTYEGYRADLKLFVKSALGGEIPGQGDIRPYE